MTILNNATDPYYLINFGDNSPIEFPTLINQSYAIINHTYAIAGNYEINITVFNKVSKVVKLIPVKINKDFHRFQCIPIWYKYPSADTNAYVVPVLNGLYQIRKEYDLFFKCSWRPLGKKSFI